MEYYQAIQNRAAQTVAVINQYEPTLGVGAITVTDLLTQTQVLGELAQQRDHALVAFDAANAAEHRAFVALRALTMALPKAAQGELDDAIEAESTLLDLLSPVYSVDPRNSELAIKRAKKLVSALTHIDAYLAAQNPPRLPIRFSGQGIAALSAAIDALPSLAQTLEDRGADVSAARAALRTAAVQLDRINKRFYSKLKAEARANPALAQALTQIETGPRNLPTTLSIHEIRQGGMDNRQLLVNYVVATYDDGVESFIEWRFEDEASGFAHALAVDPSGNALGPFASGARVQLRTRVNNSNGTRTSSVRTLEID